MLPGNVGILEHGRLDVSRRDQMTRFTWLGSG
jgi:hypothetical protein